MIGYIQIAVYAAVIIYYWVKKGQTPGQKAMGIITLDARTEKIMYLPQAIFRFFCYFLSMISLVGFFLPVFRKDKKALHDLIAHTRVVHLV